MAENNVRVVFEDNESWDEHLAEIERGKADAWDEGARFVLGIIQGRNFAVANPYVHNVVVAGNPIPDPDPEYGAGWTEASEPRTLSVAENPPMPSDEFLHQLRSDAERYPSEDFTAGLRAVWRHGCDAGMAAVPRSQAQSKP